MKKLVITLLSTFTTLFSYSQISPCVNGFAGSYPCKDYDLMSRISLSTMNAGAGNDSWGWTDPQNGDEYAIIGLNNGTAFIDISNPTNPVYLGKLPTATSNSSWRDVKVYKNHAFIVSEASGHGMQVFDLTRLRNVANPPQNFTADARYTEFGNAHNIVINEDSGYAYVVGAQRNSGIYRGGPLFIDIQDPKNPRNAGGFLSGGQRAYTHDAQVVTYSGPDTDYTGREILIGSNEIEVVIADITDKSNPTTIATIRYSDIGYTHQGWFTENQRYFILGDETDEQRVGFNTRTVVFDFQDLDNPQQQMIYNGPTPASDHNGYVKGDLFYLANYRAGIRVIDISNIGNNTMTEIGFFDTFTSSNSASFNGVWNVYPYFNSGNIVISDIEGGFFLVRKSSNPPSNDCSSTVSSFPFTESFETNLGEWKDETTGDDLNWTRNSGNTPSNGTGPSAASDGSTYIYVEASGNGTGFPNKRAILNSPCLNFDGVSAPKLTFQYHMLGSAVASLTVEARTNNTGNWTSVFSRTGSQGANWNEADVDLAAYAGEISVQLRFNVVTGAGNSGWQSDIAIDAVSIQNGGSDPGPGGCISGITSFPYSQGFENTLGSWSQSTSDDLNWTIDANGTPSQNTGPSGAAQGTSYIYVEASGNGTGFPNKRAIINSPCFNLNGISNPVFSFDYHMFGAADMGSIDLEISVDNGITWANLWNQTGNQGNSWNTINIDLSAFSGQSAQLRFNRVTGGTWRADIAIDNISLTDDTSRNDSLDKRNDMIVSVFPNPVGGSTLNVLITKEKRNIIRISNFEIRNALGQLVRKGIVRDNIDVSNLTKGAYFLQITLGNQLYNKPFIRN
ncbi:choice-of-anchor B family protein [Aquimarina sp. RZ0]|uniref:choice-of-anchor B family protein n=1 Tax=Aquimarina sp. RZ0 TaxID=2607730 RepID=UPI0011F344AE|nr:choice-of-anchor B family protein [Aquimarina sp. RZ0]